MKKNICIVGCGKIGRLHSRNLSGSCDLTFHSRSAASANKLNRELGGSGIYERFDVLLADPSVDAVVICTPPQFHCQQVVQALRAGKSVLVEKPFCISWGEALEIGAALEAANGTSFLMVAENYLYKPSLKKIKEWLAAEQIGRLRSVKIRKVFHQSSRGWKRRYGALLEGGVHFVALLADIMDGYPVHISSRFPQERQGHVERNAVLDLYYRGGARAQLEYGWDAQRLSTGLLQHSSINGDEGRIIFESNGLYAFLQGKEGTKLFYPRPGDVMGYKDMTRDFLACIEDGNRLPYSNYERAKGTMEIIFRAYGAIDRTSFHSLQPQIADCVK